MNEIFKNSILNNILDDELKCGNCIQGGIQYDDSWLKAICITLKKPFFTPIRKADGVSFNDTNDPHYWKAQYMDINTNPRCILMCTFDNNAENQFLEFKYEDGNIVAEHKRNSLNKIRPEYEQWSKRGFENPLEEVIISLISNRSYTHYILTCGEKLPNISNLANALGLSKKNILSIYQRLSGKGNDLLYENDGTYYVGQYK